MSAMTTTCDEVCEYCTTVLAMSRSDLSKSRSFERMAQLCALDHIEVDITSISGYKCVVLDPSLEVDATGCRLVFTDITAMFHGVARFLRHLPQPVHRNMVSIIDRAIRAMEQAVHGDDVVHVVSKMREITV